MTALIFLDTETCGLGLDDPIWEIALIRREPDGAETRHEFFVQHDLAAAEALPGINPEQFERHTAMGDVLWAKAIYDRVMGVTR